jgi:hypothetical protein
MQKRLTIDPGYLCVCGTISNKPISMASGLRNAGFSQRSCSSRSHCLHKATSSKIGSNDRPIHRFIWTHWPLSYDHLHLPFLT